MATLPCGALTLRACCLLRSRAKIGIEGFRPGSAVAERRLPDFCNEKTKVRVISP